MKFVKNALCVMLILTMMLSVVACTDTAPYIGDNGNWFVGGEDTGVSATGPVAVINF